MSETPEGQAAAPDASSDYVPTRAMVVVAHADDIEFSCAGTVATWVRAGLTVTYVICTDSSKGSEDPAMSPQRLAEIRLQEQRAAARVVGVEDVVFLPYEDGDLEDSKPLRRDLVRLIRDRKPDRLITLDPTMRYGQGYVNHPDHIAAGNAALAAAYPFARNRPTFPELLADGLEPHKVRELYLLAWTDPDVWVDIAETLDLKIAALREHKSQLNDWDPEEMVRKWSAESGKDRGLAHAEAFKYLKLD